ncbi:hypothetical protein [Streptomyces silvensis]|uniref:WD40 repeat domain-containing protein n=1 Tax=Streptomyces silvensis TaxID=1765722 RepID=A0A0W7WT47_9ACTN|nr:hypothetical protein [Streptomyces silvensis]KUF13806.1 hypothetical protein AT728_00590 [Streptomyces silvensis]
MNVDRLVRETLQEQAAEQPGPSGDLAGRVLAARRRRRNRAVTGAALATAVVAAAVAVPALDSSDPGRRDVRPAGRPDVVAHPDQAVPRDFVAAGRVGMAGYAAFRDMRQRNGDEVLVRSYWLLNPRTQKYEKADDRWAWVAVAPGMRTAAVLEGELPARRIGLLDLASGEVTRWITPAHPAAAVEWSPDGKRLVATTYSKNPDRLVKVPGTSPAPQQHFSRTGWVVVDAASGDVGPFRELPQTPGEKDGGYAGVARQDLHWSHDGSRLYVQQYEGPRGRNYRDWYTMAGDRTAAPERERHAGWPRAGLSPDGKLLAADGTTEGSPILDPRTGKQIARVPSSEQLAWADSNRLIALSCGPGPCTGKNEQRTRLVLVTVGSDRTVPLTALRERPKGYKGVWSPMLTTR